MEYLRVKIESISVAVKYHVSVIRGFFLDIEIRLHSFVLLSTSLIVLPSICYMGNKLSENRADKNVLQTVKILLLIRFLTRNVILSEHSNSASETSFSFAFNFLVLRHTTFVLWYKPSGCDVKNFTWPSIILKRFSFLLLCFFYCCVAPNNESRSSEEEKELRVGIEFRTTWLETWRLVAVEIIWHVSKAPFIMQNPLHDLKTLNEIVCPNLTAQNSRRVFSFFSFVSGMWIFFLSSKLHVFARGYRNVTQIT